LITELSGTHLSNYTIRQKIAEQNTKAIYIHSHMDADNFDIDRVRKCPVVVPDAYFRFIPTCAYNNIYRQRDPRFNSSLH